MFLLPKKTIKALLSIADGRAASFFNTFIKIITPPPFLRAADFRVQRYEEKTRYGEKFREKQRKTEKNREKMAAYLSNPTDVVRCFTQFFRIFAYEKTRSMIPRDFRTEVWLVEGTPFPKHSRNIPETIPKDRWEPFLRKLIHHLTGSFPAFHRAGKQNVSRPVEISPTTTPSLSQKLFLLYF